MKNYDWQSGLVPIKDLRGLFSDVEGDFKTTSDSLAVANLLSTNSFIAEQARKILDWG